MSVSTAIKEVKALKAAGTTHSNRMAFLINFLRTNGIPVIIR